MVKFVEENIKMEGEDACLALAGKLSCLSSRKFKKYDITVVDVDVFGC